MNELIYPRDRSLTALSLVLGILVWIGALVAAVAMGGAVLIGGAVTTTVILIAGSFLSYLFARSAAIAHLRGNAIEVSDRQLPELHEQLVRCCQTLSIKVTPTMYVQNGNGVLNAFATWFLGRKFVILLSGVVDAMEPAANGVRFYIGHELAHIIRHDNPVIAVLRWPALRLPLLGAAFSRARESTCDRHGRACSETGEAAARSVAALSAGSKSWASVSLDAYRTQLAAGTGFWMSFHELTASYPWTVKRAMRVLDPATPMPRRNPFAYLLALFIPYAGRLGAGFGLLIYVYIVGVLAAIAIPAYQNYTIRATLTAAAIQARPALDALARSYEANKQIPASLGAAGVSEALPGGGHLTLNPKGMIVVVQAKKWQLIFTPRAGSDGHVSWTCSAGEGTVAQALPPSCR